MGKLIDLTGRRYGRLFVEKQMPAVKHRAQWLCRCDCGALRVVPAGSLRYGHTRSCGCLRSDIARTKASTLNGCSSEKLHGVWNMMKQRCQNPNNQDYKYYGARGIGVCDSWKNYLNFRSWALANGYEKGLTIDRIDSDGNYEAGNCRWISIQEQQKNRRHRNTSIKKD
ncbi:hypothetical protein B6K86_08665 [Lachnospiraceae bacterium]|nr:hypothetical protein B6K86_08665 [Lachnospiraceae bacterium]